MRRTARPAINSTHAVRNSNSRIAPGREAGDAGRTASRDRLRSIGQPVLLRVDRPPQDPSAFFDLELRDLVDQRIFLMWQLGML